MKSFISTCRRAMQSRPLVVVSVVSAMFAGSVAYAQTLPPGVTEVVNPSNGQTYYLYPDGSWKATIPSPQSSNPPPANPLPTAVAPAGTPVAAPEYTFGDGPLQTKPAGTGQTAVTGTSTGNQMPVRVNPAALNQAPQSQTQQRIRGPQPQGGLFGLGRDIMPGDPDYNRGSLNPKLR